MYTSTSRTLRLAVASAAVVISLLQAHFVSSMPQLQRLDVAQAAAQHAA